MHCHGVAKQGTCGGCARVPWGGGGLGVGWGGWQSKCAGTSLRSLLYNRTQFAGIEACVPSYSHSHLAVSRGGCGYSGAQGSVRPAVMAGHFLWREYEWMLETARQLVRATAWESWRALRPTLTVLDL